MAQAAKGLSWALTERPNRSRILLEAYTGQHAVALSLAGQFGGRVRQAKAAEWITPDCAPPTRIGRRLEIVHEKMPEKGRARLPRLHIPHGLAFGSGDHATTRMLLGDLTRRKEWGKTALLDLGTGSGILALTARLLGARKIVAADFDAEAVRTARQNELLNFSSPLIGWRCSDVLRLRATARYDLVLANLYNKVLCEAAPQITSSVAPGGQLWLSGVLRTQQGEVVASYRRQRLRLIRVAYRGKWVMLQWSKP